MKFKHDFKHHFSRMSSYKGDPFVFGGCCDHNSEHNMAESYTFGYDVWTLQNEYPFSRM